MPSYCTLQGVRKRLDTDSATDDAYLAALISEASQMVEDFCGQNFDERITSKEFPVKIGSRMLDIDTAPLIAITTLTNVDGTVIAADGYSLFPTIGTPKRKIILTTQNAWVAGSETILYADPDGLALGSSVRGYSWAVPGATIAGKWGFHRYYSSAWPATGLTGTLSNDTTTAMTISAAAGAAIDVGDVLLCESEQVRVTGPITSASAATTLTVERGYNSTTAAAHITKALYRWSAESTIVSATEMIVAALYKSRENATGDRRIVPELGALEIAGAPFGKVRDLLVTPFWNQWTGAHRRSS